MIASEYASYARVSGKLAPVLEARALDVEGLTPGVGCVPWPPQPLIAELPHVWGAEVVPGPARLGRRCSLSKSWL